MTYQFVDPLLYNLHCGSENGRRPEENIVCETGAIEKHNDLKIVKKCSLINPKERPERANANLNAKLTRFDQCILREKRDT